MKALSIRQPWAWAILHAGKRVENRAWEAAPRAMLGQVFAIHAALGCTRDEYEDAALAIALANPHAPALPELGALTRGAIVGTAKLVGVLLPGSYSASPWYAGALGLVLGEVRPLVAPVRFRGALGFFDVPDELVRGP